MRGVWACVMGSRGCKPPSRKGLLSDSSRILSDVAFPRNWAQKNKSSPCLRLRHCDGRENPEKRPRVRSLALLREKFKVQDKKKSHLDPEARVFGGGYDSAFFDEGGHLTESIWINPLINQHRPPRFFIASHALSFGDYVSFVIHQTLQGGFPRRRRRVASSGPSSAIIPCTLQLSNRDPRTSKGRSSLCHPLRRGSPIVVSSFATLAGV